MVTHRLIVTIAAALTAALGAMPTCWAADLPAAQQFVNVSGLPGGGIVLNSRGQASREGAVQINIPIAFTPSLGYWAVGAWAGDYVPPFRDRGHPDLLLQPKPLGNGTGLISAGVGRTGHGVYLGLMFTSRTGVDTASNLQWQVLAQPRRGLAGAVGVQDLFNTEIKARSFYLVFTKQVSLGDREPAVTLGYGNGRFEHRVFGGFSLPLVEGVHGVLEHDGFQWNAGLVIQPLKARVLPNLLVGLNQLDRLVVGLSLAGQFE